MIINAPTNVNNHSSGHDDICEWIHSNEHILYDMCLLTVSPHDYHHHENGCADFTNTNTNIYIYKTIWMNQLTK